MHKRLPTIQDVARSAGVSTATVSRALTDPTRVSDATRQRVTLAVRETGYTVNQAARSLRKQNSNTLLVALPDIGNPFFSVMLDAIERTASEAGFATLIASRKQAGEAGSKLAEHLQSHRVDGVLVLDGSIALDGLLALHDPDEVPPIILACEERPGLASQLPVIKSDNVGASRKMVRHLIELGHQRIAHITGDPDSIVRAARLKGYREELIAHGIPVEDELIIEGDFSLESGAAAAQQFLALSDRPSAVFCSNDMMAVGFISEIRTAGLKVPRDVSVGGFDDIMVAEKIWPGLTTMHQDRARIGSLAAEALIQVLTDPDATPPRSHFLDAELVVRGTTALKT
ncbi:LacI family DNA-binding transcriptional regulator [Cucumibacter marinus]|uniref:LacI family DNA-binding transcriptional regulator n=1 Tax=Cucumibacter marinus TaxID=1121252 RepID=UPI00048EEDA7|nr:LacI family DNA-binding transcriptional regulator [Cucumibacter marinus]